MLKCPCDKYYMGQKFSAINIRLNEHRSSIGVYQRKSGEERELINESVRKFGETTVARHFIEMKHGINEFRWVILEQIYDNNIDSIKTRLLRREVHWIVELKTFAPKGLNETYHFSAFL